MSFVSVLFFLISFFNNNLFFSAPISELVDDDMESDDQGTITIEEGEGEEMQSQEECTEEEN